MKLPAAALLILPLLCGCPPPEATKGPASATASGPSALRLKDDVPYATGPERTAEEPRLLFFATGEEQEEGELSVWTVDLAGDSLRLLHGPLPGARAVCPPALSPDGNRLAYVLGRTSGALFLVDLRTDPEQREPERLVEGVTTAWWTQDGRLLYSQEAGAISAVVPPEPIPLPTEEPAETPDPSTDGEDGEDDEDPADDEEPEVVEDDEDPADDEEPEVVETPPPPPPPPPTPTVLLYEPETRVHEELPGLEFLYPFPAPPRGLLRLEKPDRFVVYDLSGYQVESHWLPRPFSAADHWVAAQGGVIHYHDDLGKSLVVTLSSGDVLLDDAESRLEGTALSPDATQLYELRRGVITRLELPGGDAERVCEVQGDPKHLTLFPGVPERD